VPPTLHPLAGKQSGGFLVGETLDHVSRLTLRISIVKREHF
jgi:hypothetical protein